MLAFAASNAFAEPFHVEFPAHFGDSPPTTTQCEAAIQIACYGPLQYEQAYNMKPLYRAGLTAAGQDDRDRRLVRVAARSSGDLNTFDAAYGLPSPPSFNIIPPAGDGPPFNPNDPDHAPAGAIETSLDVEYAHAMAPGANILLVETPVAETEGTTGLPGDRRRPRTS